MAGEITVARESSVRAINAVGRAGKVSTRQPLSGWNNTYMPKSMNVKVNDWLKENDFYVEEGQRLDLGSVTFKEYNQNRDSYQFVDTFIRDAIEDAIDGINKRKKKG